MGLSFRAKTGRIANGSRTVVAGQITTGQKVFPNTFNQKTNPYDISPEQRQLLIIENITPTPSATNTPTPTPTPVPTPTPTTIPDPYTITFNINVQNDGGYFRFGVEVMEDSSTDIIIDWGDGSTDTGTITFPTGEVYNHIYSTLGEYKVGIIFSEPLNVFSLYADQND